MRYLRLAGLPNGPKLHRTPPRSNPRRPHATSTPQLHAPAHSLTTFPIQLPYQTRRTCFVKHCGHDNLRCMIRALRPHPDLCLLGIAPAPATWPASRRSSSCHSYVAASFDLLELHIDNCRPDPRHRLPPRHPQLRPLQILPHPPCRSHLRARPRTQLDMQQSAAERRLHGQRLE